MVIGNDCLEWIYWKELFGMLFRNELSGIVIGEWHPRIDICGSLFWNRYSKFISRTSARNESIGIID